MDIDYPYGLINYMNGGPINLSEEDINYYGGGSGSAQDMNNHVHVNVANDDDEFFRWMNNVPPDDDHYCSGAHVMPTDNYDQEDINLDGLITIGDDDDDIVQQHFNFIHQDNLINSTSTGPNQIDDQHNTMMISLQVNHNCFNNDVNNDVNSNSNSNSSVDDHNLQETTSTMIHNQEDHVVEQGFNIDDYLNNNDSAAIQQETTSNNVQQDIITNDHVNLDDDHNIQDQTTSNQHFGGNTISLNEDYHNWLNNGVLPSDHMDLDDDWMNIMNSIDNIGMVDVADQHLKTLLPMATSDCSFNNGTADDLINSGANEGDLKKDGNSNSNSSVDDHNVQETTSNQEEGVVEKEEGFNIGDYLNNNDSAAIHQEMTSSIDNGDQSLKTLLMPMGYRFMPNDNKLIYYLSKKVNNQPLPCDIIPTVDLYQLHPQDLLNNSTLGRNEKELYVFTHLKARNKGVTHAKRTTPDGFWKATSGDNDIKNRGGEVIGIRKVLVYYHGKGSKTNWIMHEYRLNDHSKVGDNYVLCKIHNHTHKKKAIH
ncbi:hypothetical protein CASFOL_024069 [Castilleja foliolosa]|uniref:NAC domain-containing protein n=1 Tax=Castilleja foliolosa TaxID=1961234 RepID=A0ABD3CMB3_9LAMI